MPENETVAIPNYVPSRTQQVDFGGALNAVATPHTLAPNEVQTSTNLDYSLEWGGASPRRGNQTYAWESNHGVASISIALIGRNYALSPTGIPNDSNIPWYMCGTNGVSYAGSGVAQVSMGSVTGYNGGNTGLVFPRLTQYNDYTYIANGTSAFRTNGTSTFDWLIPKADTPLATFFQFGGLGAGPFVGYAGSMTATEGSATAYSTSTYLGGNVVNVGTFTTGTGSRIVAIGTTGTNTNWENPIMVLTLPTGTAITSSTAAGTITFTVGGGIDFHQGFPNGITSGTYTASITATQTLSIGAYGTDYMLLGLTDLQSVVSISRDLSIGDNTFANYWHSQTTPSQIKDAAPDPIALVIAQQGQTVFQGETALEWSTRALNNSRSNTPSPGRSTTPIGTPPHRKTAGITTTQVDALPWAVARSDYQFNGSLPSPDFTNIHAIRVTIEYNTTKKQAAVGGLVTFGAQHTSLNDQSNGIQYYHTYARVENGVIVAEGAASDPTPATKAQYAYATLQVGSNSNTTAGITHHVFYRIGGLLQDAYRVGSCTITASNTAPILDYNNPDFSVINNKALDRNTWAVWPSPSAGTGLVGVNALSEIWNERVFVGVKNYLYWSALGQPSIIQDDTQTPVGDTGDWILGLIPWNNLIIVNQSSVYEMSGTDFEHGTNANWSIQKSGARRGSGAPNTIIKTPYGILLFSYDGMSLYLQGYGIDEELKWVYDKIGDLWKGSSANDPASFKGRIPPLNNSAIFNSAAAYKDEKIYLAVPTGTNTLADTTFVIDMAHQKVWMHQFPFNVCSLFFDKVGNRLMAGTDKGTIQQLEFGLTDAVPSNSASGIPWSFRTRAWSTPTDTILENLQVENVGTWTGLAITDNTNTYTLSTASSATKGWTPCSLQGTIGDNVVFQFNGTQSGTHQEIYQTQWDFIPQAPKITFFQTDVVPVPSENYVKTWLAEVDGLGTSTITATLIANGTALTLAAGGTSTALIPSASSVIAAGRRWFEISLQNPTTAKQLQAVYKSTTPFKYYDTQFEFQPKPFEKSTWLVTYAKIGGATQADMARFYAMDIEADLFSGTFAGTATIVSTWFIDGAAFTTNTFTIGAASGGETIGVGRLYADQVPFPPGARGYLFQQQLTGNTNFRVWKAHVDIDRIGVKGLSRVTLQGTPTGQDQRA